MKTLSVMLALALLGALFFLPVVAVSRAGTAPAMQTGLPSPIHEATQVGTPVWYPPYQSVALKGRWVGEDTFLLLWQYVGEPYQEEYKFTFNG